MSISLQIPCPRCGRMLKLKDRSLLGRKGRCPGCDHHFVLVEPEEIELELADGGDLARSAADQSSGRTGQPTVSAAGNASATASSSFPNTTPQRPTPSVPTTSVAPTTEGTVSELPPGLGPIVADAAPGAADRMKLQRRQRRRQGLLNAFIGLVVLSAAGGTGYYFWTKVPEKSPFTPTAQTADDKPATPDPLAELTLQLTESPTRGEPVPLAMIPAGAAIVLHLRPAELWQPESLGEELRFCLGPLGEFIDQQLQAACRRPPADIESATLAWIPALRGTPPDFAVVVRLKEEAKKSELLDLLGGTRDDSYGHPVYVSDERAAVMVDLKTYAIGPAAMAEEMVTSIGGQNPLPTSLESLIDLTDRTRHITLLADPNAVLLDAEQLVPTNVLPLLRSVIDWFADGAEGFVWSGHLEADRFFSQLLIRNPAAVRPPVLEQRLQKQLAELPQVVVDLVSRMQPTERGKRQLIGRLPAMLKVFSMATVSQTGPRHVEWITPLPDRAAPNLALASLLAWDESTRTDFTKEPPSAAPSGHRPATATLAERLNQNIEIDFRKTPLYEAIAYIANETGLKIDIDGDSIKLAGFTQNMEQNMQYPSLPASQALSQIIDRYKKDGMCMVIDEATQQLTVTTKAAVDARQLKLLELPPALPKPADGAAQ
jgi:hypothetical protein